MFYEWKLFWCCLNPRERDLLTLCLFRFVVSPGYMMKTEFDSYWLTMGFSPASELARQFVADYRLTLTVVTVAEEEEVEVYTFDAAVMSLLYEFSLTDDFICAEPCFILRYSNP